MSLVSIYLCESATLITAGARDQWGEQAAATETAISVRVIGQNRKITTQAGEEVVSSKRVWLENVAGLSTEDRLRLDDGMEYQIVTIAQKKDFTSVFTEVSLV